MAPPRRLVTLQAELRSCTACPEVVGPVVHGPPIKSPVFLLGQAPGVHEGDKGRPFAWTAGKTLFQWLERATGADEETIRGRVYFSAVARCFPGKAKGGGGDRRPSSDEIERCRRFIEGEIGILRPKLVLPIGTLAIEEVLGHDGKLVDVIGTVQRASYHGVKVDVIALPHPSGASTWHRTEPGKTLLARALELVASHEAMREALG
ncbi:MAG: uracil-DNA glycosylase family protein [Polyangiaceae bacterium]|jgi:uracil-DNA glycosylase|nr:uracil-DNA glycosylase family protein [Polyangiaceae bacterium]